MNQIIRFRFSLKLQKKIMVEIFYNQKYEIAASEIDPAKYYILKLKLMYKLKMSK
jgi:hypothetical protein